MQDRGAARILKPWGLSPALKYVWVLLDNSNFLIVMTTVTDECDEAFVCETGC